jgi:hypothetical protein
MPSERSVTLRQLCQLIMDASSEQTIRALIAAVVCYSEPAEAIASELLEVDHVPDDGLLIATPADATDIAPNIEHMSQDIRRQVMVNISNENMALRLLFIELLSLKEPTPNSRRLHTPSGLALYKAVFKSTVPQSTAPQRASPPTANGIGSSPAKVSLDNMPAELVFYLRSHAASAQSR